MSQRQSQFANPKFPNEQGIQATGDPDYYQKVEALLAKPKPIVETGEFIKGQSQIEYVPYERVITEYEEVRRQVQVPYTTLVTDYYPIEYEIEYIPQVKQVKQVEYVPVEKMVEQVEYQMITNQKVLNFNSDIFVSNNSSR